MLELITPPDDELISLDVVKLHCKVDNDDEDELIQGYLDAARDFCEGFTNRALSLQTWRYSVSLDNGVLGMGPDEGLWLPRPPFRALRRVVLTDFMWSDAELDLSNFRVIGTDPGVLRLIRVGTALYGRDVVIEFDAGYTKMPPAFRQAMLQLVAHYYENREATTLANVSLQEPPLGVTRLLNNYREINL